MARAILKKTREARVRSGHPWVFASDVEQVDRRLPARRRGEVVSSKGVFQGRRFYNPQSQISLRMLTRHDEPWTRRFFPPPRAEAIEYRRRFSNFESCRLIFAESDFLPALIVDKFADVCWRCSRCAWASRSGRT